MPHQQHGRAVVIGGGICGLATARVLSEHFREVVLVERDPLPEEDTHRSGTPQARHVHGLLSLGARHLERLFPELRAELKTAEAPVFDHGSGARTQVWAGTLPPRAVGIEVQTFHRDTLEGALRRRVRSLENVTILDGTPVDGLHVDKVGGRVTGVRLRGADEIKQQRVADAEWVVDATGRFSRLPQWLEDAGYDRPHETVIDADLAYATALVEAEPPEGGVHAIQQMNQAPTRPGGVYATDIGRGIWMVTLFGAGGHHPLLDEDGWRAFAAGLRNPGLDRLLDAGTLVSGVVHQFKETCNRRREYAALHRWPDRLVALGDSAHAFNPVFGQGMTVAVCEAVGLGVALARRQSLNGLAQTVQRNVAQRARGPWMLAVSEDLVWSHAKHSKRLPLWLRAASWYKQRLLYLVVHSPDARVMHTFLRVFHMITSPAAIAHPRIVAQVLFRARSPRP
ncbi:FAD-dependent oxidoreductase [Streptomyces ficellus]|uniref:FAD-dependent oxidoreductase n=1 Tax=Streptomyces ficellus TaxID=1977088 RepID=A0ABT7Z4Z8_9ACTN|nr:FAD-dependent oxidoreductase [Streptomyces ficellus]MDN3294176.1 FAD-dependent oxidoreductase [Streptomyces ficellus]